MVFKCSKSVTMTSKYMKIWTVTGKKKAITAVDLLELKTKGINKLEILSDVQNITVYLDDGTEIDEDDIYQALPDGTVLFLCKEGENPSQSNVMSSSDSITSASLLDCSTVPAESPFEFDEGSTLKKPWPQEFTISFHRCSSELIKQMKKGISYLNWQTRHELLAVIAEDVSQYTLHPDLRQRKQVAACLIKHFPLLKSGIDDGLNGWAERLYAKMKDFRMKQSTGESKAVRKIKKKKECVKVPHRGESNFLPPSNLSPEEELNMVDWMKKEALKPKKDQDRNRIDHCLVATFPLRRKNLTSKIMPFKDIKENYPLLFSSSSLFNEFKSLQDSDIFDLITNFKKISDKIITEATKRNIKKSDYDSTTPLKKKRIISQELKEKILSDYDGIISKDIDDTVLCAFLLLPILLHDDPRDVYKIVATDSPISNVSMDTCAPIITFVGNPFDSKEIYICGETIILISDIENALTAIAALFCLYYVCNIEYPSNSMSTFLFLQNYLLKIHYGKKLPPKLINLLEKF